jgi:twitching motility protein PilT
MAKIDSYFQKLKDAGASDLHLLVGAPPKLRIHGELEPIAGEPVQTQAALEELLFEIIDSRQKSKFQKTNDLDFAYGLEGVARFRCNFLMQKMGLGAVFRIIPERIKTIAELNLPKAVEKFAHIPSGLILVTGPTGSGKSTTLAAIIDLVNSTYSRHILTIEDPIEFVHQNKNCLITQREVGQDTRSFANALRAAGREDADVVLVGEMRDLETISLAITLSEMGQLVFGTLHTNNAAKTIDRVVDVFPSDQQSQVRTMLSDSLRGIVSQQLVRTKDGKGRAAVLEILFGSPALANIIREGKTQQIVSIIQGGKSEGMQSLDHGLMELIQKGVIHPEEAYRKAQDKKIFEQLLKTQSSS